MDELFMSLKDVDQSTKDIVTGYLQHCRKLFSNNFYPNIPSLVTHLCMQYYFIAEYFSAHGSIIYLNEKRTIATINENGYDECCAYGNIAITNNTPAIYKWHFRMIHPYSTIYIGIDSSNKKCITAQYKNFTYCRQNSCSFYACSGTGTIYSNTLGYSRANYADMDWRTDDIVIMQLNAKKKTLKYYLNGIDKGIAFENIEFKDTQYHMAVCISRNRLYYFTTRTTDEYHAPDSVELIHFERSFIQI
eukprot:357244_1